MNFPKSFHTADCNRDKCEYVEYEGRNTHLCVVKSRAGNADLKDAVNPGHYSGDLVMRVIEERGLDFALGNAVKYLCRAGSKPGASRKQDLLKAQWYLNRAIEKEESSTE